MDLTVTSITALQRLNNCFNGIKENLAEIPVIQSWKGPRQARYASPQGCSEILTFHEKVIQR
ncbi:hypothetical protein DSO57_1031448 [Entomophthora muscae]|uniref:Uncharacterized protein n=1 Tax=Entomophthora muscae TaxID=34485 RepID=A0ACC2UL84_9FUNG|nr:hypothetical protein DSO57_1031448 [Entomophthora muscae]